MTQIVSPSWKRSCALTYFGATCVITQVGGLSWHIDADVGGGWWRGYIIFFATVNSGSYANGKIDAEVTCYAGTDAAERVGMHSGDTCNAGDTPILSDDTTPTTGIAIGETKWLIGAGSHTYQTGYFGIAIPGNSGTGETCDAYFRLNRLRWGSVIIWDREEEPGYPQNNDIFTSGAQLGSRATEIISTTGTQLVAQSTGGIYISNTRMSSG